MTTCQRQAPGDDGFAQCPGLRPDPPRLVLSRCPRSHFIANLHLFPPSHWPDSIDWRTRNYSGHSPKSHGEQFPENPLRRAAGSVFQKTLALLMLTPVAVDRCGPAIPITHNPSPILHPPDYTRTWCNSCCSTGHHVSCFGTAPALTEALRIRRSDAQRFIHPRRWVMARTIQSATG